MTVTVTVTCKARRKTGSIVVAIEEHRMDASKINQVFGRVPSVNF